MWLFITRHVKNLIEKIEKNKLSKYLKGASLYCTLEPCAHEGKTPSCAKLLATYPLKKVVIATKDPFKKVNGEGVRILKEAGIKVELCSFFQKQAEPLNLVFFHNLEKNLTKRCG